MEQEQKVDLIKYKGFKNVFVGLYKGKEYYYMLYGKTAMPTIINDFDIIMGIPKRGIAAVKIPFLVNNNKLFTGLPVNNEEEYDKIVSILEDLL